MNKREYKATIRLVQDRYESLKLTFAQAEQVYQFEEQTSYSYGESFSFWEEMDFQMDTFRSILTPEQWAVYEPGWQEQIEYHVKTLIKDDQESLKKIAYYQDILDYYQKRFIPEVKRSGLWSRLRSEPDIQPKADYLRTENKIFWQKRKKNILIHHYRHLRQHQPLSLQASLLQHQLYSLMLPTKGTDKPIKAALQFVKDRLPVWYFERPNYATLWEDHLVAMQQVTEQHWGKRSERQGWRINISTDPEKDKADFLMGLLLMSDE